MAMDADETKPIKKPYQSPTLTTYGDIRELTLNTGSANPKNDTGGGGKTKT
jgi:hypothetical protein